MAAMMEKEQNSSGSSPYTELTDESGSDVEMSKGTRRVLYALKFFIGMLLFVFVLGCSMFSKLTLVSITDQLRNVTWNASGTGVPDKMNRSRATRLYWQLFFIMILPNVLTFARSFVFGVFGKTKKSFPWPMPSAILLGLIFSAVEVLAISIFVFLVLSYLPPDLSILLLNGVFVVQIIIDSYHTPCRPNHDSEPHRRIMSKKLNKILGIVRVIFENKTTKLLALGLQLTGIVGLAIYLGINLYDEDVNTLRPVIVFPLVLIVMSFIWSNWIQKLLAKANMKVVTFHSARYKSSFINSGFKVLLYPFISYIVFRFFTSHHVDPWCLQNSCDLNLDWKDEDARFIVQILTTFFAYLFVWISCTMTLHWSGLALPLILSTPFSLAWYYIQSQISAIYQGYFLHYNPQDAFQDVYPAAPFIASALWFGEILAMGYYLWTRSNIILARDTDMFLIPYYDGVFLEQQIMLNRQTTKGKISQMAYRLQYGPSVVQRPARTIFICSTMYRENHIEMSQMLTSIYRVAHYFEKQQDENPDFADKFESHIFFDGSINGTQLTQFALQLVSLLEDVIKVKLEECRKEETPYGYRLTWFLRNNGMPFTIHMKDNLKVKNKKRWSQVMYMNYVLNYRIQNDPDLEADNTFILTTDADIDFTAESAVVLLDNLAPNPKVGAVCARTHPKGAGPLYWYQIFDYAIGHWFQKPAEHILGCVLCCPGCFSVFRCSALKDAIEEYSSGVTSASEFLTKDMGEDRWLCTLLIQKGWRLDYCAISKNYTYCPEGFDEFFKQRRRWIPSTVANLSLLISEAGSITRGNDTVSILFILFQAIFLFSTAISPATVILVIASGLHSAYKLSDELTIAIIVILILVSVIYGIICIYTSQKTQLDVAKLLTFIFAVIMAVVVAGIFKDLISDIFPEPKLTFLQPPDCSSFLQPIQPGSTIGPIETTSTPTTTAFTSAAAISTFNPTVFTPDAEGYENCVKAARYLGSLPNTTANPTFKLPVSTTTIYLGAFAFTFIAAAVLHLPEWACLLHVLWYLLALPSGYLLLLIYSAANLNNQSWGTREGKGGSGGATETLKQYLRKAWKKTSLYFTRCCGDRQEEEAKEKEKGRNEKKEEEELPHVPESIGISSTTLSAPCTVSVQHKPLDPETEQWLKELKCERYAKNFEDHGYVNKHFISSMKSEDFEAIGIDKRGFKLRLEKAAKKLPSLPIETSIPDSVEDWLRELEMEEYTEVFHAEGYETKEDVENLKDLTSDELKAIGIRKRAHLQRLQSALKRLFYPSQVELQIRRAKAKIENVPLGGGPDDREKYFWETLINRKLKPDTVRFTPIADLKANLKSLRNSVLAILLLVNLMWIILLYTLEFSQLIDYGLESRAFQTLFLAVYGIIIVIQFITLLCHRAVTLVHYLGRTQPTEIIGRENQEALVVTLARDYTV